MTAIAIHELTKDYEVGFWRKRKVRALDHLSLTVHQGEIFGFLGPNGAGKTTTLKILMRLIYPTSGEAEILGRPFEDIAMHARIGYLPENPYFYDYLTADEFLRYCAALFGLSARRVVERIDALLKRVGLSDARQLQLRKFSKGMLQRVGIAQALVNEPEVIFLDEPMSGLDPLGRREIRDLILNLKKEGKTVFFSSHILPDVETLCDRVAILYKGKLQGCGSLTELLAGQSSAVELIAGHYKESIKPALRAVATDVLEAGSLLRVTLADQSALFQALDILRESGAQVIHVHPLKESFEDYFVKLFVNEPKAPS